VGLPPRLRSENKFIDIQRLEAWYCDIENTPGWKHFTSRIDMMRKATINDLMHGTLDKHGNSHDDERRAVLTCLERILGFRAVLHEDYEKLKNKQEEMLKRAEEAKGKIHGSDFLASQHSNRFGKRQF
jgi:hypothetical protein